eukprot:7386979-Prymnesium_polylepis.1
MSHRATGVGREAVCGGEQAVGDGEAAVVGGEATVGGAWPSRQCTMAPEPSTGHTDAWCAQPNPNPTLDYSLDSHLNSKPKPKRWCRPPGRDVRARKVRARPIWEMLPKRAASCCRVGEARPNWCPGHCLHQSSCPSPVLPFWPRPPSSLSARSRAVSYTHLRAHETLMNL